MTVISWVSEKKTGIIDYLVEKVKSVHSTCAVSIVTTDNRESVPAATTTCPPFTSSLSDNKNKQLWTKAKCNGIHGCS